MSHEKDIRNGRDKLIYMANQIAAFFETMPHEEAVEGTADHINKYWEPRMRRQFFDVVESGGEGLSALALEAAPKVKRPADRAA